MEEAKGEIASYRAEREARYAQMVAEVRLERRRRDLRATRRARRSESGWTDD